MSNVLITVSCCGPRGADWKQSKSASVVAGASSVQNARHNTLNKDLAAKMVRLDLKELD